MNVHTHTHTHTHTQGAKKARWQADAHRDSLDRKSHLSFLAEHSQRYFNLQNNLRNVPRYSYGFLKTSIFNFCYQICQLYDISIFLISPFMQSISLFFLPFLALVIFVKFIVHFRTLISHIDKSVNQLKQMCDNSLFLWFNDNLWFNFNIIIAAKASLTASRSAANAIYVIPLLQVSET